MKVFWTQEKFNFYFLMQLEIKECFLLNNFFNSFFFFFFCLWKFLNYGKLTRYVFIIKKKKWLICIWADKKNDWCCWLGGCIGVYGRSLRRFCGRTRVTTKQRKPIGGWHVAWQQERGRTNNTLLPSVFLFDHVSR